jgi:hypothetical protein
MSSNERPNTGHVISEAGIATDPEKTKIVESWPVPTNVKELRSFMGFCGYYRKFIQKKTTASNSFRVTQ